MYLPVSNRTEVYVGPWTNLGTSQTPGWAKTSLSRVEQAVIRDVHNVAYCPEIHAFTLQPDIGVMNARSMELANFVVTGDVDRCKPVNKAKYFLHAYNSGAAEASTITSKPNTIDELPEEPWFILEFIRTPQPPVDQSAELSVWTLTLPGGYILRWGMAECPSFTFPDASVRVFNIDDAGLRRLIDLHQWEMMFYNYGGDVYVRWVHFEQPFVIEDVGTIPAGVYTMANPNGHAYAFALTPYTFATGNADHASPDAAYLTTEWADVRHPIYPTSGPSAHIYDDAPVDRPLTVTASLGAAGNVDIEGTDRDGATITETIVAVNGETVTGTKSFRTVTEVTLPAGPAPGFTGLVTIGYAGAPPDVGASADPDAVLGETSLGATPQVIALAVDVNPDGLRFQAWPPPVDPDSVQCDVAETDGTRKRFKIFLTGDGSHTPVLQSWEVKWDPTDGAAPTPQWVDITPWFAGGNEGMGTELTGRTATLQLRPNKMVPHPSTGEEITLYDWIQWNLDEATVANIHPMLRGHYAIAYRTWYLMEDNTTVLQDGTHPRAWVCSMPIGGTYDPGDPEGLGTDGVRMYGLVKSRRETVDLSSLTTLEITAYDRGATVRELPLFNAPCLLEKNVGAAIAELVRWGGVPQSLIVVDPSITPILSSPHALYDVERYVEPDGTSVGQAVTRYCEKYDLIAEFRPDGTFHITNHLAPVTVSVTGAGGGAGAVTVTGTDDDGLALVETLTAVSGSTVAGVEEFSTITSVALPAGTGTIAVGHGASSRFAASTNGVMAARALIVTPQTITGFFSVAWPAPALTLTHRWNTETETAPDYWHALSKFQLVTDQVGMTNTIIVKGFKERYRTQLTPGYDGSRPIDDIIYTGQWDTDSIYDATSDRFLGYPAIRLLVDDSVHAQEDLQEIADLAFKRRKGGHPMLTISGPGLWTALPRQALRIRDRQIGDYYGQIESVNIRLGLGVYEATATVKIHGTYAEFLAGTIPI